nr:SGNH hydrolase domain-containing protein [Solirubrobacter deserti]
MHLVGRAAHRFAAAPYFRRMNGPGARCTRVHPFATSAAPGWTPAAGPHGRGRWSARALACALLALAALAVAAAAEAAPHCFGAASRDPERRCLNPGLARLVAPTPDQALLNPNFACRPHKVTEQLSPCTFGATHPSATVALIGDSHAQHMRPALAVVARRRNWRVEDASVPLCMFSTATTGAGPPFDQRCPQWNADVMSWLHDHPEIRTIFVAGKAEQFVMPAPGQSAHAARLAGYIARFSELADRNVIVVRDAPAEPIATKDCVRRRMAHQRPLEGACSYPRRLAPDPAAAAARATGRPAIDLTRQFCDSRRCYPVIGGALVHKDTDHLTQVFARTLGPFLDRALTKHAGTRPSRPSAVAAPGHGPRSGRKDRNGLDRDEETPRKPHVRRSGARRRRVGHVPRVHLIQASEVLDVGVEDRRLDHVVHRRARRLEHARQVGQRLLGLSLDPLRDRARRIDAGHPGAEDEAVGDDRLAVRTECCRRLLAGHCASGHRASLPYEPPSRHARRQVRPRTSTRPM